MERPELANCQESGSQQNVEKGKTDTGFTEDGGRVIRVICRGLLRASSTSHYAFQGIGIALTNRLAEPHLITGPLWNRHAVIPPDQRVQIVPAPITALQPWFGSDSTVQPFSRSCFSSTTEADSSLQCPTIHVLASADVRVPRVAFSRINSNKPPGPEHTGEPFTAVLCLGSEV